MRIQSNKMLPPTYRVIRPFQCSWIATEGPNISGKIDLSGIEIPYDSQSTARMVLNPGAKNQPIMYGFLGNKVTFITIKVTYSETDPNCVIEENKYLEYWFEDEPSNIMTIGKIMVLTGNSTNRVPQIYLNNPTEYKVYVDVLLGNLEQDDLDIDDIRSDVITIDNLYHNSILSDKVWDCVNEVNGSSQLQVSNIRDEIVLYLEYSEIDTIEKNEKRTELSIRTKTDTTIFLRFLNMFELYQAHSRISWVLERVCDRHLTKESPPIDITPPEFILNDGVLPIDEDENLYAYPFDRDPETDEFKIYPTDILMYFIYRIEDEVDGRIMVTDSDIKIRKMGDIENLDYIDEIGTYEVTIVARDIAHNQSVFNIKILLDDEPPVITFTDDVTDDFIIDIPDDLSEVSNGITVDDILEKTVIEIHDTNDGILPISSISMLIFDGENHVPYTPIKNTGNYVVTFVGKDSSLNESYYTKNMIIGGYDVINEGDVYEIDTIPEEKMFIFTGVDQSMANVVIDGVNYIIFNDNNELIWDYDEPNEYRFTQINEYVDIVVNSNNYRITFKDWGSFLFSIDEIMS